ncbi:MAG: hypothetical protein ACE5H7_07120 [Acidiferrobacterales bacterium]
MSRISRWLGTYRLLPIALAFILGVFLATAQSFAGKSKDETASTSGHLGKTVFVDVSALGRRSRAAKRMSKMHMEYAKKGWTVVNVAVYVENGDLEGFFVTYVKD